MENKKLFILGLDCLASQLVFDMYLDKMPYLSSLLAEGKLGLLKSTDPPLTVPAWMSMFTGKDPGQLGFYGFTDRASFDYFDSYIVNSSALNDKTVWNYLSEKDLKSIVINVPQTYPPNPLKGLLVADFLTPDKSLPFTYPKELRDELDLIADGNYIIDVDNFMAEDKEKLINHINDMTEKRFEVIKNFIKNKDWNLFIAVEMGVDRMHHGFWKYCFRDHPLYEEGNKLENAIEDYYKLIDNKLKEIIETFDDNTELMIVSDHGAKSSKGSFCLNDWLIKNGYLVLKNKPEESVELNPDNIDWNKTKAWAKGGYYGRIFLNIAGREPRGIIKKEECEEIENKLIKELSAVDGIKNEIYSSKRIYKEIKNFPPDLFLYCGSLDWRVLDTVGNKTLFNTAENSIGDNANHDFYGVYISSKNPKKAIKDLKKPILDLSKLEKYSMLDITPTILDFFKIEIPDNLFGKKI